MCHKEGLRKPGGIQIINTLKRNTEALLDASKEVCVEINAEKIMYMLMSLLQNAG
jgi:hypothetical protein